MLASDILSRSSAAGLLGALPCALASVGCGLCMLSLQGVSHCYHGSMMTREGSLARSGLL